MFKAKVKSLPFFTIRLFVHKLVMVILKVAEVSEYFHLFRGEVVVVFLSLMLQILPGCQQPTSGLWDLPLSQILCEHRKVVIEWCIYKLFLQKLIILKYFSKYKRIPSIIFCTICSNINAFEFQSNFNRISVHSLP